MGKKTLSKTDRYCRRHDIEYERYLQKGKNPYWYFNKADERFLSGLEHPGDWQGRLAKGLFGIKRRFAPKMEEDYPVYPVKRLKEDGPDLPSNLLTSSLVAKPNVTMSTRKRIKLETPSNVVASIRWLGPFRPCPKSYEGPWRNHSRNVGFMATEPAAQVTYHFFSVLDAADMRTLISGVPITYWDDVGGVDTMRNRLVNYNTTNVNAGNKGKTMWHWRVSFWMRFKNNSETTARLDFALFQYRISASSTTIANILTQANEQKYNTQAPAIPYGEDPKIILWDAPLINVDGATAVVRRRSVKYLAPGQTVTLQVKYSVIADPTNIQNISQTYMPGNYVVAVRLEGDIGHDNSGNVALRAVDSVDWEKEMFVTIHKKETMIRDFTKVDGDALPLEISVENVNQFGLIQDQ